MRRRLGPFTFVLAVLALSLAVSPVRAKRTPSDNAAVPTLPASLRKSRSLGLPWKGSLKKGVLLKESPAIRYVTEYRGTGFFYGTWQLVQLLERAAHRVGRRLPGARLSVGEMSRETGGDMPGHASHESGRDVDVGFYMLDAAGKPYDAFAYARFDERGRGLTPNQGLRMDLARNWEFVARLVTDPETRVQYVFIAPALKALLLAEGKARGASEATLSRASRVMVRPSEKHPHGNHFHVRIYCGPEDRPKCQDAGSFWPWYPGKLPL